MSMMLVLLVRLYQWTLRPFIGAHCRFEPSCSHFAIEALQRHGALHGGWLAACRVARCNPWVEGGLDPVPCRCAGHHLTDRADRGHAHVKSFLMDQI